MSDSPSSVDGFAEAVVPEAALLDGGSADEAFAELDRTFMQRAIELAELAPSVGEVPVGAVVVHEGRVIAQAHNRRSLDHDPTAHAELIAMRDAARILEDWRLEECTVYVTLEPCPMCAGAMVQARVARCVYGCTDPKAGYMGSLADLSQDARLNHRFPVTAGVEAERCGDLLRSFFQGIRQRKKAARRAARAAAASSPPPTET